MKALVTGAAGFVGRALVARLVVEGWDVAALDRIAVPSGPRVSPVVAELADAASLELNLAASRPGVVFHLAASRARTSDLCAFRGALEANLLGTLSLVEAMTTAAPAARLVAVGTAEEYGDASAPFTEAEHELPVSAYSLSKLAMTRLLETLARVNRFPAVVLRPSVAYGPGQAPDMFLSALVEALVAGREFPMTAGEQTRDFVYLDDLIDALLAAGTAPAAIGRIINIGSGTSVRVADVAFLAERLAGASGLVRPGAVPYRSGEPMEYALDVSLAEEILGWRAKTSLEDGLRATIGAARAKA